MWIATFIVKRIYQVRFGALLIYSYTALIIARTRSSRWGKRPGSKKTRASPPAFE